MTRYEDVPPEVVDPDAWLAEQDQRAGQRALFLPGGCILDASPAPEPIWGSGSEVLASRGETMIITGGIGSGKTTLLGSLVHARIGLSQQVLGWPVQEGGRVLYLACDRPRQIMRNLRRRFDDADRQILDRRLIVWKGPPPRDFGMDPHVLREMCAAHDFGDGDTVVIDGLKDVARDLVKDETGSGLNNAFQLCVRDGIEVWCNHHQRKATAGQGAIKPKSLADVYGSMWITAGAGTVLLLWADKAGSAYTELSTLKPAADDVGPITVHHDLDTGKMTAAEELSIEAILQGNRCAIPITEITNALGAGPGDRNRIEQVRRRLSRLAADQLVEITELPRLEGGKAPKMYRWIGPS